MAQVSDNIVYLLARCGVFIANTLSDKRAYKFGGFLGRSACRIIKSRRIVAFENLKHALGKDLSDEKINEIIIGVFENIGRTLIEFSRFKKIGPDKMRRLMKPAGLEILEKVKKEGKGAIIVTAHFGNWEMLNAFFTVYGFEADGMVAIQHNQKINKMITGFRETYDIGLISVGGTDYRKIFKALKNNRFVIIASDQHDPSESLIMDFFGRKTTVARGPALFAIKNKCPIITILNRRVDYDKFEILMSDPIYPPNTGDIENDTNTMSRTYMDYLEKIIKQYPDQWLWTHKRWKI